MEKIKELAALFLPEGILEYFEYAGYERKSKEESKPYGEVTIVLVEKNKVPKLPDEYRDRKIRQKGFKEIRVDDFPVRGNLQFFLKEEIERNPTCLPAGR